MWFFVCFWVLVRNRLAAWIWPLGDAIFLTHIARLLYELPGSDEYPPGDASQDANFLCCGNSDRREKKLLIENGMLNANVVRINKNRN